eukprot:8285448-Pyramimonas_sp.AAC.1
MVTITAKSTMHRCSANETEATIDHCFIPAPAPRVPHLEARLAAGGRPLECAGGPASDRKCCVLGSAPVLSA